MTEIEWYLFTAQLPVTPSSLRVGVWRKLSDSGAVNLQSGLWILPHTDETQLFLERLLAYIRHHQATGQIFTVQGYNQEIQTDIFERFESSRKQEYEEFLDQCKKFLVDLDNEFNLQTFTFAELEENEQNLHRLKKWFTKIQKRDYFKSKISQEAADTFQNCRTKLRTFAHTVLSLQGIGVNSGENHPLEGTSP